MSNPCFLVSFCHPGSNSVVPEFPCGVGLTRASNRHAAAPHASASRTGLESMTRSAQAGVYQSEKNFKFVFVRSQHRPHARRTQS